MSLDLGDGVTLVDVPYQYPSYQILCFRGHKLGYHEIAGEYLLIQDPLAVLVEWQESTEHREQRYAAAPNVHGDGIVLLTVDDLQDEEEQDVLQEQRSKENRRRF